jgi:hypothetical protein
MVALSVGSQRFSILSRSAILAGVTLTGVPGTPIAAAAQAIKDVQTPDTPLVLKAQGSFFVGGEKAEQTQVELGDLGPGGPHRRQSDVPSADRQGPAAFRSIWSSPTSVVSQLRSRHN